MSSRIFRMWPAMVMALLLAAVWHWGVPAESVRADNPPGASSLYLHFHAASLLDGAVVAGDFLTVDVGGFSDPGSSVRADRVWLYLWTAPTPDASFPGCASSEVAQDDNLLMEGFLDENRVLSFRVIVRVPPFQEGDSNFVCALRVDGESVSRRLQVDFLPDVYLMQLELNSIVAAGTDSKDDLLEDDALKDDFEVTGGRGLTEWGTSSGFTQVRGVDGGTDGISGDEALLEVSGEWWSCPRRNTLEVGCEWEDLEGNDAKLGGRYSDTDVHLVPGDDLALRVSLPTSSGGDLNLAAERFVVLWGPVDVWLLGTEQRSGGVEAADYVVHDDHLRPLTSELNSKIVQLSPGDSVDLPISRSSANWQGHTFVSMVACNDSYLKRLVGSDAVTGELAERLRGLEDCTVQQGPAFEDYGSNMPPGYDDDAYIRMREIFLADAWLQNNVRSGRELYCEIVPTIYRDWDDSRRVWRDSWTMEIFCENPDEPWDDLIAVPNDTLDTYSSVLGPEGCYEALVRPYFWDSYDEDPQVQPVRPVDAVPPSEGNEGTLASPAVTGVKELESGRYRCGWGPHHFQTEKWPIPLGYTNPWYTTRYNAADSFYSFAVEWKEGGFLDGDGGDGCSAMLLPYNVLRGGHTAARYPDTSRWRVGRVSSRACEVEKEFDSVDLFLKTPRPPGSRAGGYWQGLAHQRTWGRYPDHSTHFAVYVSGMPTAFDYRMGAESGDTGVGESSDQWRLVSLGSWVYDESGELLSGSYGGRSLLGVAHPVGLSSTAGDGGSDRGGALDSVPAVGDFYDGLPVTVTRDFANDYGEVDVYVVPCRPLQSGAVPVADDVLGACEHLPAGRGHVRDVTFEQAAFDTGPFGLVEPSVGDPDYKLQYSIKFTVRFRGSAWHDNVERRVSLPVEEGDAAEDECVVSSAVESGILYWSERLVSGGACDRNTLDVARVVIRNDGRHGLSGVGSSPDGGRLDRLVVYVTGGRSDRLDLMQVNKAGQSYEDASPLGRLGVRERSLSLDYGSSGVFHVSPDIADKSGEVWLLAYSCGADSRGSRNFGAWGHCPWVSSVNDFYDVPVPPSFVVRVSFTSESGLEHADLGPVCQGDDCAPLVPVLREAGPEVSDGLCGVSSYTGGSSDLLYWPDRLVRGGACAPRDLSPVSVNVSNVSGAPAQDLVFYATGGRTTGFEDVQVRRGPFTKDQEAVATLADGLPAGASGLRRVYLDLDGGETGRLLVDADLADEDGTVLLLAYLCSGSSECPGGRGADREIFDVDRRPLFQVLVEYYAGLLMASGFSICKGDDCLVSYELERFDKPSGEGCSVSASYSEGSLYWPDRVIAGGNCDRYGLSDVPVNFHVPTSASDESLVVYVTGGRTPGLEGVSVRRGNVASSGLGRRSVYIPFPEDVDVGDDFVRANITATVGVLDDKPWVQDGLVGVERQIYYAMQGLAGHYSGADSVAGMPFLDAVDETDYLTVRALVFAASKDLAGTVVGHSEFSGGITDSDRILVIGASMYSYDGADKVIVRLDDGPYEVEDRIYSTPETAQLQVSIARDQGLAQDLPGASELVRKSVESMEDMMGRSFPTSHVIVFLDDGLFESIGANVVGYNYGGVALSLRTGGDGIVGTLIHEVAHYFWFGSRIWISEGMAEAAIAIFGPNLGVPDGELLRSKGDCVFGNLSELDAVLSDSNDGGICPYELGQHLFWDLRESLGGDDFRVGVRRLYETILTKRDRGVANRQQATIDDLRAAFSGNDDAQGVIARHWSGASTAPVVAEAETLGRLGLRQRLLTVPAAGSDTVYVSPDLAGPNGDVWLFAYRCDSGHGDSGCPVLSTLVQNGYDLPKGPEFAVRVRFTPESGLAAADLQEVCRGQECDIVHPWLRTAEPDGDDCSVVLGVHWPDRVVRGGGCYLHGANYGSVAFRSDFGQKFVVYSTGGGRGDLRYVPVYGVLGGSAAEAVDVSQQLGGVGLLEHQVELASAGEVNVWVRSDMADDDGNVWLFVYSCDSDYGDVGCPLVDGDVVRPSYNIGMRPDFVVRVEFLPSADAGQSTLEASCSSVTLNCSLKATFRDADGNLLPGRVQFRVDAGALGGSGSTAQVSEQLQVGDDGSYRFEELLALPSAGSVVNVEAELLGDGLILRRQLGVSGNLSRISASVLRCSGDEASCHSGDLELEDRFAPGAWFVLEVTGYDAAGNVALSPARLTNAQCTAGPSRAWPEFRLSSLALRSHGYGTSQPADRGYAGCAIQVSDDAANGSYDVTVSHLVEGGTVSVVISVLVSSDEAGLFYLDLYGPASLDSGESGTYRVLGFDAAASPLAFDSEDGCVELSLTGALEHVESGTAMDGCLAQVLPVAGVEFTVRASDGLVYETDSSVGVSYGGRSVRQHVLAVPAVDGDVASPSVSESHISDLTITQEDTQLKISWVSNPTSEFVSLRAQGWVMVGGVDVFLPGCQGGEVWETTTYEVFCLLSYGQSGDVYRAAVVFIRFDNSAMPVETAEWTRP